MKMVAEESYEVTVGALCDDLVRQMRQRLLPRKILDGDLDAWDLPD